MTERDLEPGIQVPKTFEQQLRQLIDATGTVLTETGMGGPLRNLQQDGQLDYDFIMNEIELIRNKRSGLPFSKRAAIVQLVGTALKTFMDKPDRENR